MQRTHEENLITWQGQISNDAGSNKCSAIPSNIEENYSAMTLSRLGFVFSTHANAFKVKLHSKKLFPWFISAKFWRVAIQVLLKISLKTSIIVSFILASETRSIFHANRCHEPSYSLIQFDALLIIRNSAVACSFTLLTCTSQSDKKSFMRRHHHQLPFFRRKVVLFCNFVVILSKQNKRCTLLIVKIPRSSARAERAL